MTEISILGLIPEYCAFFVLLVIMFINRRKNSSRNIDIKQAQINKNFFNCELLTFAIIIIDIIRFTVNIPMVSFIMAILFHCSIVMVSNSIVTYIYDMLPSLKEKSATFYKIKSKITFATIFIMGILSPTGLIYGLKDGKVVTGKLFFISYAVGFALFTICIIGAYRAKVSRRIRFTLYLVIICTVTPCIFELIYRISITSGIGFISGLLLLSGMFNDGVFDMTHGTESFANIGKRLSRRDFKVLVFTITPKNDYSTELTNKIYDAILNIKNTFRYDTLYESNGRYAFIIKNKYVEDIISLWKTIIKNKDFNYKSIIIDSKYLNAVDLSILSNVDLDKTIRSFTEADMNKIKRKKLIKSTLLSIVNKDDYYDDRIVTVIQPIKNLETNKFITGEMLTRLKVDGIDDIVMPGEFIPIVEELKCIHKFNLCVLDSACRLMRKIQAKKLDFDSISVNFDPSELTSKTFVGEVVDIVTSNAILPKNIHIEITESSEISDTSVTNKCINELLRLGFSVYLDDFGTKYSNIAELLSAQFNVIKIDRQLILKALENDNACKVITAVSSACSAVGYKVLFEGVDSDEGIKLAYENNAAYIQGFCYSKPLSWDDFITFIKANNNAQLNEKYG